MFLEKILQKEIFYFVKDSLSAGAAHKLGFPWTPHSGAQLSPCLFSESCKT